jgi:radical SAM protein with 4Fe4S-binding SPASM domain
MNKLKIFNALPKRVKVEILRNKMPRSFTIEATNICNLRCLACPWHSVMTRKKEFLTFENFKVLFGKIEKHASAICFYLMGEPFLNPDIFKMIALCKKKGVKTFISSNAMLVGNYIDEILNSGLTTLQMTMDGFKAETHERYRVGSNFETVKNNIKTLAEEKKRRGLKEPIIHIQTLMLKTNKDEIKDIENFVRELGIDHHSVKAVFAPIGPDKKYREEFVETFVLKNDNFKKYDRTDDKNSLKFYKNQIFCPQLTQCVVLVNGDVVPCCFDYDGSVKFGNLFESDLKDIWRGKIRQNFLLSFFKKNNPLCKKCDLISERGMSIF